MPHLQQIFLETYPEAYFLQHDKTTLQAYLSAHRFLQPGEELTDLEKAGEGNMNYVLRAKTNRRSFIVKQSRPWVEKYPQIAAPGRRAGIEGQFYHLIQKDEELQSLMPALLFTDEASNIIILEDLGVAADLTYIYGKEEILPESDLKTLVNLLSALHNRFSRQGSPEYIRNIEMRQLNHEHLFIFPLNENNGMDLDAIQAGLSALAIPYQRDEKYREAVRRLGDIYLADGNTLLHGDYYPGSWLSTATGVKVIDPEFCFFGPAEFEVGVFCAHLLMAQQSIELMQQLFRQYRRPRDFDTALAVSFAGVEIMRRLIGIAQLPLQLTLEEKKALLAAAHTMVLFPESASLYNLAK
jgi:5-methylthioribose kinase